MRACRATDKASRVTGLMGPATRDGLRRFPASTDLPVSGLTCPLCGDDVMKVLAVEVLRPAP
jgi:hypothetical protein